MLIWSWKFILSPTNVYKFANEYKRTHNNVKLSKFVNEFRWLNSKIVMQATIYLCKIRKILMQTNVYQFINEYGRMYQIQMYTYVKFERY